HQLDVADLARLHLALDRRGGRRQRAHVEEAADEQQQRRRQGRGDDQRRARQRPSRSNAGARQPASARKGGGGGEVELTGRLGEVPHRGRQRTGGGEAVGGLLGERLQQHLAHG